MKLGRALGAADILLLVIFILLIIALVIATLIYQATTKGRRQVDEIIPVVDDVIEIGNSVATAVETYFPAINQVSHEYYQQICIPHNIEGTDCWIDSNNTIVGGCPVGCADAIAVVVTCAEESMIDNPVCQLLEENDGFLGGGLPC